MRLVIAASVVLCLVVLAACVDTPLPDTEPQARLIVTWDPLTCGTPHRVVLELEGDYGVDLSTSTRCELGALSIDLPRWGVYRGRVYAWELEATVGRVSRSRVRVGAGSE
jgi:hypothetical protein